jgi:hypothetical protein
MTGLASATPGPSPSGARLAGDDVQHLIGWYWLVSTLQVDSGIESVEFESSGAGNLDDVVINRRKGQLSEYWQVKTAVKASEPMTSAWLMKLGRKGGPSILQRFYRTWLALRERGHVVLVLATDRSLDHRDPVLALRDHTGHLAANLRRADRASPAGTGRAEWATHVGASEEELCQMLDNLEFQNDATEVQWERKVQDVARGSRVKSDEAHLLVGVGYVRKCIEKSRASISPEEVRAMIQKLDLQANAPEAILVINMLARSSDTSDAAVVLDWVDYCEGDSPETRAGLRNQDQWNSVLLPQLQDAASRLKPSKAVIVRGEMRLPTRFAVGAILREVAGFSLKSEHDSGIWSSLKSQHERVELELSETPVGHGSDIALVVGIASDITPDTDAYISASLPQVGKRYLITLAGGSHPRCVSSPEHGVSVALAIRDKVRVLARKHRGADIHLFLATQTALALQLGHFWDRLPPTQLYEYLGNGNYQPAFLIR